MRAFWGRLACRLGRRESDAARVPGAGRWGRRVLRGVGRWHKGADGVLAVGFSLFRLALGARLDRARGRRGSTRRKAGLRGSRRLHQLRWRMPGGPPFCVFIAGARRQSEGRNPRHLGWIVFWVVNALKARIYTMNGRCSP